MKNTSCFIYYKGKVVEKYKFNSALTQQQIEDILCKSGHETIRAIIWDSQKRTHTCFIIIGLYYPRLDLIERGKRFCINYKAVMKDHLKEFPYDDIRPISNNVNHQFWKFASSANLSNHHSIVFTNS